jgi:hypothetical protein
LGCQIPGQKDQQNATDSQIESIESFIICESVANFTFHKFSCHVHIVMTTYRLSILALISITDNILAVLQYFD